VAHDRQAMLDEIHSFKQAVEKTGDDPKAWHYYRWTIDYLAEVEIALDTLRKSPAEAE